MIECGNVLGCDSSCQGKTSKELQHSERISGTTIDLQRAGLYQGQLHESISEYLVHLDDSDLSAMSTKAKLFRLVRLDYHLVQTLASRFHDGSFRKTRSQIHVPRELVADRRRWPTRIAVAGDFGDAKGGAFFDQRFRKGR